MSYRVTAGANAAHSKSHSKLHNHIIFVRICFLNENGGSGSVFYFKDYVTLITLSMSVPVHVTYCFRVPLWTAGYCSGCWRRYWTPRSTLTPSWNDWGWGTGPQINWPRISHQLPAVCNIYMYKHSYHISIKGIYKITSIIKFFYLT